MAYHYTLTNFSQTICVKGLLSCTVLQLLSKLNCSYACEFALVSDFESLICSSVLTLLPYTLDYSSIIARLQSINHGLLTLFLFYTLFWLFLFIPFYSYNKHRTHSLSSKCSSELVYPTLTLISTQSTTINAHLVISVKMDVFMDCIESIYQMRIVNVLGILNVGYIGMYVNVLSVFH